MLGEQWRVSMDQQVQEAVHRVLHAQASTVGAFIKSQ